jgi:hypothetical protein
MPLMTRKSDRWRPIKLAPACLSVVVWRALEHPLTPLSLSRMNRHGKRIGLRD